MILPPSPARPPRTGRPTRCGRSVGALAGLCLIGLSTAASAQDAPRAVETPGRATLRACRNWVMYNSCNEYGRVDVPKRIALGDELFLEFGSNPKSMSFPVKLIQFAHGVCTLYADLLGPDVDEAKLDRLTIAPCRKASLLSR
jgi:hypothetical protein